RLAFAVAAHLEPEILVVDEVLAVGDAEFQRRCLGKMSEVARGGRTVLLVSHNMAAVQNLCRVTVLLRSGLIIGNRPTDEVIKQYLGASGKNGAQTVRQGLGPDLELTEFGLHPARVRSGEPAAFGMGLTARAQTTISHLCALIYSNLDTRVAVVDLRS